MAGGTDPDDTGLERSPTATTTADEANATDKTDLTPVSKTGTTKTGIDTDLGRPDDRIHPNQRQKEAARRVEHNLIGKQAPTTPKESPGPSAAGFETGWALVEARRTKKAAKEKPTDTTKGPTAGTNEQHKDRTATAQPPDKPRNALAASNIHENPTPRTLYRNGGGPEIRGAKGSDSTSTGMLTDSDLSDEDIEIPEPVQRETFSVPIRVDLLPTEGNETGSSLKWMRRVFSILKHSDKTTAVLSGYDHAGKRRRFKEVADIPPDIENHFRVKNKQHRRRIRTLFATLETALTPAQILQLSGIRNINSPTNVLRLDRYDGEVTQSTGWLRGVHPSLTHAETLSKYLKDMMDETGLPKDEVVKFQQKLPDHDRRKAARWDGIRLPCFHLTTEERYFKEGEKKRKTKVMAIHTSASAAPLITTMLSSISTAGRIEFVSRDRSNFITEVESKALKVHKKMTSDLAAIAVYRMDTDVMTRERKLPDGSMISLKNYIIRKTKAYTIERTNKTDLEGKFLIITKRENVNKTKNWVLRELPKYYRKYQSEEERNLNCIGPKLTYEEDCSPQTREWTDILHKRLAAEADSEEEEEAPAPVKGEEKPDMEMMIDDDDKFIITNKKQKINYKDAIRQKTTYSNPHYEGDLRTPLPTWTTTPEPPPKLLQKKTAGVDIQEAVSATIAAELPKHMKAIRAEFDEALTRSGPNTQSPENKKREKDSRGELELMIEKLTMNLEKQRAETGRISEELRKIKQDSARASDIQAQKSEAVNRQMTALGNAFQGQQVESEKRSVINRQMVEENMRILLHRHSEESRRERQQESSRHSEASRRERQQESSSQMQRIENFFSDSKQFFAIETQKITAKVAQTAMDVKELTTRIQSVDNDLQATSIVATYTTEYLDRKASDYYKPTNVEYETIVTPSPTPSKPTGPLSPEPHQRPPLEVARLEC